jgi:palmitoyl-protein thioesterase
MNLSEAFKIKFYNFFKYKMKYYNFLMLFSFIFSLDSVSSSYLPVAIIHGFRQMCSKYDLISLEQYIGNRTGEYSKCMETGGGSIDISRSFYDQAKKACELISQDDHYKNKNFAIVSISQGSVLARYVIEKCKMPDNRRVSVFVSIGGPVAGTHQLPHCQRGVTCHILNSLVDWFVYRGNIQEIIGPAGYFRVSNHLENYKESNSLLLDINNQGKTFDEEAKNRFKSLDLMVLIAFKRDTMISPKESAHFGEYDDNHKLVDMKDTEFYKNDLFGLKTLDEANKIKKFWVDDLHCRYNFVDIDMYIIPYISGNS